MVKTTTIELISKKEFELIRITKDILKAVEESGVQNGVVYAITAHTTTGILVNESGLPGGGYRKKTRGAGPHLRLVQSQPLFALLRRHRLQRAGPSEIHDLRQPCCLPHCRRPCCLRQRPRCLLW